MVHAYTSEVCSAVADFVSSASLPADADKFFATAGVLWPILASRGRSLQFIKFLTTTMTYVELLKVTDVMPESFARYIEDNPRSVMFAVTADIFQDEATHTQRVIGACRVLSEFLTEKQYTMDDDDDGISVPRHFFWLCAIECFQRLWRLDLDGRRNPGLFKELSVLRDIPSFLFDEKSAQYFYRDVIDAVRASMLAYLVDLPDVNPNDMTLAVLHSDVIINLFEQDQERTLHCLFRPGLRTDTTRFAFFASIAVMNDSVRALTLLLDQVRHDDSIRDAVVETCHRTALEFKKRLPDTIRYLSS